MPGRRTTQSVIFESTRNGNYDLFRQKIDQSEAEPLAISGETKVLAHVSPDRKWILFNQQHEKPRWSLRFRQASPANKITAYSEYLH